MKTVLPLFVFIDACGWEIIANDPFVRDIAPHRRRLSSVFGYSSACIPSILSGRWPAEHRNWCYFVYDPARSPFQKLRLLRWLPQAITSRRRFRRWLSHFVKAQLKFRGYFDLYNIPFRHISLFDFTEKKNPLQPGGLNQGPNIFDHLDTLGVAYHVSDPARSERENLAQLLWDIGAERIDFAFLYWPDLDGLMHRVGNDSPEISKKLRAYECDLASLMAGAQAHYEEVRLYVFSDHGMANCDELLDLRARIDALGHRMGEDYVVVYDSTMARFWFFDDRARREITECLEQIPQGEILSDAELSELGALFPDRYFGELIFLVHEGVLIVPSHMGERPIRAMHGYHPAAKHSYATLLSNQETEDVAAIPDIFKLMMRDAELARAQNGKRAAPVGAAFPQEAGEAFAANAAALKIVEELRSP
ncbi:MAG: alkaline phosphatase family protein [Verrucomicrobiota bacterium]|nr:alkaline phosphatase family protein [Verrucomicrobiota bacterium]